MRSWRRRGPLSTRQCNRSGRSELLLLLSHTIFRERTEENGIDERNIGSTRTKGDSPMSQKLSDWGTSSTEMHCWPVPQLAWELMLRHPFRGTASRGVLNISQPFVSSLSHALSHHTPPPLTHVDFHCVKAHLRKGASLRPMRLMPKTPIIMRRKRRRTTTCSTCVAEIAIVLASTWAHGCEGRKSQFIQFPHFIHFSRFISILSLHP
jgi:hypothetical protein